MSGGARRSRNARRRAVVLVGVHVLIAAHVAHWISTGRTVSPLEPSEAAEFAKHSIVNAGLVFFALITVTTLVLGRFFCGWACHVVALQDLCRWLLLKVGIRPRPLRSRLLALVPLGAFFYMFLWPVVQRVRHGHSLAYRGAAFTTDDFWGTFPPWWGALATFFVCGFAAVYFLGAKGFCTYGCPYGALFGAVDRLAPGRIRVTDACRGCGHCSATCSSNVDVAREVADYGMVVDPGCMKCMDCVSVCPTGALYFGFGKPALRAKPRREPRRKARPVPWGEELFLAGAFALVFFSWRGLYGFVPLLMALGLGGVGALGLLSCLRLVRRSDVSLPGLPLKRAGGWTRAGVAFAFLAVLGSALTLQSAAVQVEGRRSAAAFAPLERARSDWFSPRRRPLDAEALERARAVVRHGGNALALGLVEDGRRHTEVAWASLFLGDEAAYVRHLHHAGASAHRPAIAHLELGNHWRRRGELEGTVIHYRLALALEPDLEWAYPMLADVLNQLGRHDEARAVLERVPR